MKTIIYPVTRNYELPLYKSNQISWIFLKRYARSLRSNRKKWHAWRQQLNFFCSRDRGMNRGQRLCVSMIVNYSSFTVKDKKTSYMTKRPITLLFLNFTSNCINVWFTNKFGINHVLQNRNNFVLAHMTLLSWNTQLISVGKCTCTCVMQFIRKTFTILTICDSEIIEFDIMI